jgi:hypothetical protein
MKTNNVTLKNPRTGEVWICENLNQKRIVDGIEFVEVHKPENSRMVWINLSNLVKVKEKNIK